MWKFCSAMLLMFVTTQAGKIILFSDYTITPSSQVGYYHYPAPPQSQQLQTPQQRSQSVQTYQNRYNNVASLKQQQQQQREQQQRYSQYQNYYRSSSPAPHQSPVVTRQFNSAALDNAAFRMALTDQGYTVSNEAAASSNAAITAAISLTTQTKSQSQSSSSATPEISLSSSSSSSSPSLNVKLPLPFGITPLNIATLPLQGGTPYSAIPNSVTSYGTTYPQRKRR